MDEGEELATLEMHLEQTARDLVEQAGGYCPFAGTLDVTGQVELIVDEALLTDGDYQASLARLLSTLRATSKVQATRAAGLASMGRRTDQNGDDSTAIVVSLHHRFGRCVDVVVAFSRSPAGRITYGEPHASVGSTRFFESKDDVVEYLGKVSVARRTNPY